MRLNFRFPFSAGKAEDCGLHCGKQDRGDAHRDAGVGKDVSDDAVDRHAVGQMGLLQDKARFERLQKLQHLAAVIDDG